MWCPRCHTDVAAEISESGQSLSCTSCGSEIQRFYAPSLHPNTRSARDLLERWSQSDLLETPLAGHSDAIAEEGLSEVTPALVPAFPKPSDTPHKVAAPAPAPLAAETPEIDREPEVGNAARRSKPERSVPKPRTTWRVDAAHSVTQPSNAPPVPPRKPHFSSAAEEEETRSAAAESPLALPPSGPPSPLSMADAVKPPASVAPASPIMAPREAAHRVEPLKSPVESPIHATMPIEPQSPASPVIRGPHDLRLDPPHAGLSGPHFDLQAFLQRDGRKPGRAETVWGQVLAYFGVGLITVGTTLVLWSYFGSAPQYAATGWLICTVGQMLLFLGVITLISGGMQQTSHEVTRRVEYLGDRMLRFEQSAEEVLRGPHFNTAKQNTRESQVARSENETT